MPAIPTVIRAIGITANGNIIVLYKTIRRVTVIKVEMNKTTDIAPVISSLNHLGIVSSVIAIFRKGLGCLCCDRGICSLGIRLDL